MQNYEEFIEIVKAMAKAARFKNLLAPKPLTTNMVTETPDTPDYSKEDWIAYPCNDERMN